MTENREYNSKDELINQIISEEYRMFSEVQNIGGRASCQDDYDTFYIASKELTSQQIQTAEQLFLLVTGYLELDTSGLTDSDIHTVNMLIEHLRNKNQSGIC